MVGNMEQQGRILWVDGAKAFAILTVIIGHCSIPPIIRGAIFSFHMPLLFVLSGYTTNCSETKQQLINRIKKTAKGLLVPAYLLWMVRLIVCLIIGRVNRTPLQILLEAIWAGGEEYQIAGFDVPAMGMVWFLVVLFILRNAYDIIHYITAGKRMTFISLSITIAGLLCGYWMRLPFSFDLAMTSFIFYHFGQLLKCKDIKFSAYKWIASGIIWGGVLIIEYFFASSYLGMTSRRYPILCITGALSGCMFIIYFSQKVCANIPEPRMHLFYIMGRYSILLFSIHYMDGIWFRMVQENMNAYTALMIRLIIDITLFFGMHYIILYLKRRKQTKKITGE